MDEPSLSLVLGVAAAWATSCGLALLEEAQRAFSPTRLEERLDANGGQDYLDVYLSQEDRLQVTTAFFSMIADFAFVVLVWELLKSWNGESYGARIAGVFVALLAMLLTKRVVVREWGERRSEQIMAFWMPTILFIDWTTFWFLQPIRVVGDLILRLLGAGKKPLTSSEIEDELRTAVADAGREGIIELGEKKMIEGIIELGDADVSEVMTPRTEMVSLRSGQSIEEAIGMTLDGGYSRLPVSGENRDDIVGILYVKDLLKYWDSPDRKTISVESIMRKPFYVPETKRVGPLLKEFQGDKIHIAIVLDEYGGTSGLITIEDILEEVVGEIVDEYDPDEELPFRVNEDGCIDVDPRMHVDEFNEALGVTLPEDQGFDTVGGFIFFCLGRVPVVGETVIQENIEFTVVEADERRIHKIRVEKHAHEATAPQ
ncbi:MAG: hemolysin family protein [Planctomycetota bacterium]|nr:hemolysin family protein [Planctomycetota bacterium]